MLIDQILLLFLLIIFPKDVKTIVKGIKNSTQSEETRTISKMLKARVMECPMVKAVTKMRTFLKSFKEKIAMSAKINSWWSKASLEMICSQPN